MRTLLRLHLLTLAATLFFSFAPVTHAAPATAILSASSCSGNVTVGSNFDIDFKVNSGGQAVGAVKVVAGFSSNIEYVSSSTSGTVFDFDANPDAFSGNPFVIERLNTGSGFNGSAGQIVRVTFKAKSVGTGSITITQAQSEVLANSDLSNVLQSVTNGSCNIVAAPAQNTPTPTPPAQSTPTPTATPKPTPTPANVTPTPTATTGDPNAASSLIDPRDACAAPNGADQAEVLVTPKTDKGAILTGNTYKPVVTASPATTAKVAVNAAGNIWSVKVTDTKAEKVTLTISSKNVRLGTTEVEFKTDCPTATPTPTATPAATAAPESMPTVFATPILEEPQASTPARVAVIGGGVIIILLSVIYLIKASKG